MECKLPLTTLRDLSDIDSANPSGLALVAFGPVFLAAVPVTSYITKPGGYVQSLVETVLKLVPGGSIAADRIIPAMSAIYIFWTFAGTGAISAAGQAAARKEGLDGEEPRKFVNNLVGLPLRMRSAHYNLMEMFPGFALVAALTQAAAPKNQQLLNLLGLHVLLKCFVYYPSYLLKVGPLRSLGHVLATGSIINVAWRLALGAN
jgi:uncharacterized MAPEG superfamily protein